MTAEIAKTIVAVNLFQSVNFLLFIMLCFLCLFIQTDKYTTIIAIFAKRFLQMADNDWKKRLGVVFSTNPDFSYEEETVEEQQTLGKQ